MANVESFLDDKSFLEAQVKLLMTPLQLDNDALDAIAGEDMSSTVVKKVIAKANDSIRKEANRSLNRSARREVLSRMQKSVGDEAKQLNGDEKEKGSSPESESSEMKSARTRAAEALAKRKEAERRHAQLSATLSLIRKLQIPSDQVGGRDLQLRKELKAASELLNSLQQELLKRPLVLEEAKERAKRRRAEETDNDDGTSPLLFCR